MLKTGLVSVTFRQFSPEKVIEIAAANGLQGIEWGGDLHVPPNDFSNARKIGELTRKSGLEIAAYGSYFRLGQDEDFENIMQAAKVLQTKIIRVWAGTIGSKDASEKYRQKVVEESKKIADRALSYGISVVYEFHSETLTDTAESCFDLLEKADRPNLKTYWQPIVAKNVKENLRDIKILSPFIAGVHVFHWNKENRLKLSEGSGDWQKYLSELKEMNGFALLEFVKDDNRENLAADAETLKRIIGETLYKKS